MYNEQELERFPPALEAVFAEKPYLREVALLVLGILAEAIREGWDKDYDRLDAELDTKVFTDLEITTELTKDIPTFGKSTPTIMALLRMIVQNQVKREDRR